MSGRDDERIARVALGRLFEPGDRKLFDFVTTMGAVRFRDALLGQGQLDGLKDNVAERLNGLDAEAELDRSERMGIRFVIPGDDEWPVWVDQLDDCEPGMESSGAPLGLWVKGPLRLNELRRSVAVVGSRSSTLYGVDVAGEISATLASNGNCVVSGAAYGIDQGAHRGALAVEGQTVAVLACGLDRVYPAAHQNMIRWIGEHGAVVSELSLGCSPMRHRFLSRNRVIAGLSMGTVVVEAAIRSGALSTANWTTRLSRPLMGVPGPVTSETSAGVHQLIRTGAATLVTRGEDVLELIGISGDHLLLEPRAPEQPRDRLSQREAQVLDAVPAAQEVGPESIARVAGLSVKTVEETLKVLLDLGFVSTGRDGWRLTELARC